jgi:hypothetical protein
MLYDENKGNRAVRFDVKIEEHRIREEGERGAHLMKSVSNL